MKPKLRRQMISNHATMFGVGIGIVISFVLSMLLLAGVTSLLVSGGVGESLTGTFVFAIRTIALLVGVLIGTGFIKEKCVFVAGIITLSYLILLTGLGVVLYDGSFKAFGVSITSILLGGASGCLIRLKLQNKPQRVKRIRT